MRIFLLAISLVGLISCSPNKNNPSIEKLVAPSADTLSYSFGEDLVPGAAVADKVFVISRGVGGSDSSLELLSSDFSIVSSSGCNRQLLKPTDKCQIKVRFQSRNTPGQYSAELKVGNLSVPEESIIILLSASVESPVAQAQLALKDSSGALSSPLSLSDGNMAKNTSIQKIYTVENTSSETVALQISVTGSNYSLVSKSCGTTLIKGKTCNVKLQFSSGPGSPVDEVKTGSLILNADNVFQLSDNVPGTPVVVVGPAVIQFTGSSISGNDLDFGDVGPATNVKDPSIIISIKNAGESALAASPIIAPAGTFVLSSSTCSSSLGVNKTCQVKIQMKTTGMPAGSKTATLSMGSFSLNLMGRQLDPAGVITYAPVYSSWGSCSAPNSCDGLGSRERTLDSCSKLQGGILVETLSAAECPQFALPELTYEECASPAGPRNPDLYDLGILSGNIVAYCAEGKTLAESAPPAITCLEGFVPEGYDCILAYSLMVSKSMQSGTLVAGSVSCGEDCPQLLVNTPRTQSKVTVTFYPSSAKYKFDSGWSGTCLVCGDEFSDVAGIGEPRMNQLVINNNENRTLSVIVSTRVNLIVDSLTANPLTLQTTSVVGGVASGMDGANPWKAYIDSSATPAPGYDSAVGYWVDPGFSFNVSLANLNASSVVSKWMINDVALPAPVAQSIKNTGVINADSRISAQVLPKVVTCGNQEGDYFGVAPGKGQKTFDVSVGDYSSRCFPVVKNSTSCLAPVSPEVSFEDPQGWNYKYVYKTASLFYEGDPLDPDPSYPYATEGGCVRTEISCTSLYPRSIVAYAQTWLGENSKYSECMISQCEAGYDPGSTCGPKKLYFSSLNSVQGNGYYNIQEYNFHTNQTVERTSGNFNFLRAPVLSGNSYDKLFYTTTSTFNKMDLSTYVSTPMGSFESFASPPYEFTVSSDGDRVYFIGSNSLAIPVGNRQGYETFYFNTSSNSAVEPFYLSTNTGATDGVASWAKLGYSNGYLFLFGTNKTGAGAEMAIINNYTPSITNYDLLAGGSNSINTAINSVSARTINGNSYIFQLSWDSTNGNELYRFSSFYPNSVASISRTLFAQVVAGSGDSGIDLLTVWGDRVYFMATAAGERELYYKGVESTGTTATKFNLVAGSTGVTALTEMVVVRDELYMSANLGGGLGQELYKVKNNSGTLSLELVADIDVGSGSSNPRLLVGDGIDESGRHLYFQASVAGAAKLFKYDVISNTLEDLSQTQGLTLPSILSPGQKMIVK